jgi:hypothetical protein
LLRDLAVSWLRPRFRGGVAVETKRSFDSEAANV